MNVVLVARAAKQLADVVYVTINTRVRASGKIMIIIDQCNIHQHQRFIFIPTFYTNYKHCTCIFDVSIAIQSRSTNLT